MRSIDSRRRLLTFGCHRLQFLRQTRVPTIFLFIGLLIWLAPTLKAAELTHELPTLAPMLARVVPSVVSIAVSGQDSGESATIRPDPLPSEEEVPVGQLIQSSGSGVIVDGVNGYVLTNNHLVENATALTIRIDNGNSFPGKIVGTDAETDLAVVKIKADPLTAIEFGDSAKVRVGDFVAAIGNPFGLGQSASFGIVSAVGRAGIGSKAYEGFIQTDAAINPGNSGGALVDLNGKLIGINSAIMGPTGSSVGIGFAIPVDIAKVVVAELIAHGEIRRGQLGVIIQDNTTDLASALAVRTQVGAAVSEVTPGSAGSAAGIAPGDVIIAIDGGAVRDASDVRNSIAAKAPGTLVVLSMERAGGNVTVTARLANAQVEKAVTEPAAIDGSGLLSLVTLAQIGPESDGYGKVKGGYVIAMSDGSKASIAGLTAGDIIVSVNLKSAPDPRTVVALAALSKSQLLLGVYRDGHVRFLVVK